MPGFPQRLAQAGHDHEARRGLLRELYSNVMTMPQEQVDSLAQFPALPAAGEATHR
jgi:hypothetical protein